MRRSLYLIANATKHDRGNAVNTGDQLTRNLVSIETKLWSIHQTLLAKLAVDKERLKAQRELNNHTFAIAAFAGISAAALAIKDMRRFH